MHLPDLGVLACKRETQSGSELWLRQRWLCEPRTKCAAWCQGSAAPPLGQSSVWLRRPVGRPQHQNLAQPLCSGGSFGPSPGPHLWQLHQRCQEASGVWWRPPCLGQGHQMRQESSLVRCPGAGRASSDRTLRSLHLEGRNLPGH